MRCLPRSRSSARRRSGKLLVMTALLMPVIFGFMALSVDLSVIATGKAQLQTTSDAAALAGSMQLADENRVRGAGGSASSTDRTAAPSISPEISAAMTTAITVGQDNRVLNSVPVINNNTTNSSTGDVVVGYFDPAKRQWTAPPLSDPSKTNAVLVNATRSSSHGGLLPAFFSRIWGKSGTTATSQSIAMAQNYPVLGFKANHSLSANLLPIVLDINTYNAMMARTTTDQYGYDESTGTVYTGADNVYESLLYPVSSGSPGNWGTIKVGVTDNSTSTLSAQILNGISPQQLATYPSSTIALNTSLSPPSITFQGNPGISAGLQSALSQIIGDPVVVPIYDQVGGEGNNTTYRVVAFQPCRVLYVDFTGNPKYVIIQPCLIRDPTALPQTDTTKWPSTWSWSSGGLVRPHLVK